METLSVPLITPALWRQLDQGIRKFIYEDPVLNGEKTSLINFRQYDREEWAFYTAIHLGLLPLLNSFTAPNFERFARQHFVLKSRRRTFRGLRVLDGIFNVVSEISDVNRTNPARKVVTLALTDARTGAIPTRANEMIPAYTWMLGDATTVVNVVGGTHDTSFEPRTTIVATYADIWEAP